MTSSAQAMCRVRRAHSFSHAAGLGGQQLLPGLIDGHERAPRPRPALAAVAGDVLGAAVLDVAVDEVDQRQDHRPGERVRQPGEVEQHQRRAGLRGWSGGRSAMRAAPSSM